MNMNKYIIEAASYLSKRSGKTGVKCLPTIMAGLSIRKNMSDFVLSIWRRKKKKKKNDRTTGLLPAGVGKQSRAVIVLV